MKGAICLADFIQLGPELVVVWRASITTPCTSSNACDHHTEHFEMATWSEVVE